MCGTCEACVRELEGLEWGAPPTAKPPLAPMQLLQIEHVRKQVSDLGLDEKRDLVLAILGTVAQDYIPEDKAEKQKTATPERSLTRG